MDILTDILNTAGLNKRVLHQRSIHQPWALSFPCPYSIGFHVVTQGVAYLWQEKSKEPILLHKGDIAFMARGIHHYITTNQNTDLIDYNAKEPILPKDKISENPLLTLVSGAYQLWNEPIHPIFNTLPTFKIISSESMNYSDSLQSCLLVLAKELNEPALGSENIVNSLLDVMFNLILRRILDNEIDTSWSLAFKDPIIFKALQLMHKEPEKEWTVENLAYSVGLSRSGFALKFKQILDDTPLNYLTTLRIFKATNILSTTDYTLERVASLVGYKDAFSFSKSFKRLVGTSPKSFRDKNESEKLLAWRFS